MQTFDILDIFFEDPTSEDMAMSTVLENELMKLSADSSLKLQFTQADLASFWILADSQYPPLSQQQSNFCWLSLTPIYVSQSFPL